MAGYIQNGLIGIGIGFILYLAELESPDMGNIVYRNDSSGHKVFSPESIFNMMMAPFRFNRFWTDYKLMKTNWIIVCGLGALCGVLYSFL